MTLVASLKYFKTNFELYYKCMHDSCDYATISKIKNGASVRTLEQHYRRHHLKGSNAACRICDKNTYLRSMIKHYLLEHTSEICYCTPIKGNEEKMRDFESVELKIGKLTLFIPIKCNL